MMETNVNRATPEQAQAKPQTSPAIEKTGQTEQVVGGSASDHGHIAQRAYELYMQRGRQEGQALEDWLTAERQLVGA
jgi:hypothetical protein